MKRLGFVLSILAGLMGGVLSASATTVTATLTIPVALEVRLPGEAIELGSAPGSIGSIELGVATNDWPLQLQACVMADGFVPAIDFRLLRLAPSLADAAWIPVGSQDEPAMMILPLPGEQRYRLEVRWTERATRNRVDARLVLVFKTMSGKRRVVDMILANPRSGPS